MLIKLFIPAIAVFMVLTPAKGWADKTEGDVVKYVDINRYMGKWYEIARYPNRFQKGCVNSTAQYSLRDDGRVTVVNTCIKDGSRRKTKSVRGKAWVVDTATNAKLKVSFFWPFSGDYWIIQLAEDYSYAVVGHPKKNYLWILSRTPEMDEKVYSQIREKLVAQEYDPDMLIK